VPDPPRGTPAAHPHDLPSIPGPKRPPRETTSVSAVAAACCHSSHHPDSLSNRRGRGDRCTRTTLSVRPASARVHRRVSSGAFFCNQRAAVRTRAVIALHHLQQSVSRRRIAQRGRSPRFAARRDSATDSSEACRRGTGDWRTAVRCGATGRYEEGTRGVAHRTLFPTACQIVRRYRCPRPTRLQRYRSYGRWFVRATLGGPREPATTREPPDPRSGPYEDRVHVAPMRCGTPGRPFIRAAVSFRWAIGRWSSTGVCQHASMGPANLYVTETADTREKTEEPNGQ
jgi:hypothetical protein